MYVCLYAVFVLVVVSNSRHLSQMNASELVTDEYKWRFSRTRFARMPTGGYQHVGGTYYLNPHGRIPLRSAKHGKNPYHREKLRSVQIKKPELSMW
jgi:hypothetical protein